MAQTKEGAIKTASKKAGLTVQEYLDKISSGLKKCTICKVWKPLDCFNKNKAAHNGLSASCKDCQKALWRLRAMTGHKRIKRRSGDKKQAKSRIIHDVVLGLRPHPKDLFCAICGHKGDDKRHEYHHWQGYSAMHHYDVLPLCSKCHHTVHSKGQVKNI